MKKILATALMVLTMVMISSSGYSQDTTASVQPELITESASVVPANAPKKSFILGEKIDLSLSVKGKNTSGYTEYHIQFPTYVYSWDGTDWVEYLVEGQSILAFPVDGNRIEAIANATLKLSNRRTFLFEFGVSTIISQPNEAMVDSDYVDLSGIGYPSNWVTGATQSTVNYSNYDISVMAGYQIFPDKPLDIIPKLGYQVSKNQFEVVGLAGWYNIYGDRYDLYPADYDGLNVMDYKVTYTRVMAGAQVKTTNEKGFGFSLQALYFPWVKASDHDDHLLRSKESSTTAKGKGYSIEGGLKVPIYTDRNGSVWSVGAGYEMLRITATGSQIQKWYGDDPASDDFDDTGSVSLPIDNTLKLWQNSFNVFIEYKLY